MSTDYTTMSSGELIESYVFAVMGEGREELRAELLRRLEERERLKAEVEQLRSALADADSELHRLSVAQRQIEDER